MLEQQPTRLTIDAIIQLLSKSSFQGQSFVLQILDIKSNYLGHHQYHIPLLHSTQLSDGYCKIQCELGPQVKSLAQQKKLIDNAIIRFDTNQCQVINDNDNPYIVLQTCHIIKPQMTKTIGAPMPYKLYKQKNYQNNQASNLIDFGPKTYTIKQITNNTRIKNGHIKAIVTKLPVNTSRGLFIFNIKDQQGTQIQGVCFQQAAQLFQRQLRMNEEYLFSGFVLQKNKKTNQDELKFKKQGEIVRIIKTKQGQTYEKASQKHKIHHHVQAPSFGQQLQSSEQNQQDKIFTKQQIMQLIREDKIQGRFFTIVGKITYVNPKPMFRKINVMDKNKDVIDLLLWEQIKDTVLMQKIYKFTNLRIKPKPDMKQSKYIQLQSTKKTKVSTIQQLEFQLMSIAQQKPYQRKPKQNYHPTFEEENFRKQKTKKLPLGSKIISIQQLIQLSESQNTQQNNSQVYPICQCTIKFRTEGLRFKDEGDTLNYFNFFCKPCCKAGSVSLGDNDIIFCNRCKKDDIQIKWNLRVRVMDLHSQLPCSLQSQTTERFLNLQPRQGYLLFVQSKQEFQKLLHRVNFDNRVCKFQIKTHGLNKYFNILQIYAKDTQLLLDRHMQQLKKIMNQASIVQVA